MAMPQRIAVALGALAVALGAAACASPIVRPARLVSSGGSAPPRIVAPPASAAPRLLGADIRALPGMRGWLPARDGDPVAIVLTPRPGRTATPAEVQDEVIAPLLRAMAFPAGPERLRGPAAGGLALPQPRFGPLARAVALDYAANPGLLRPETHEMLEVFAGKRAPDEDVDRALLLGEGMTFQQFKAGIERRELVFPFVQTHRHPQRGAVPIEHTLLLATAWEGESVRSVQGALLGNYSITNAVGLDPAAAVTAARRSLRRLPDFDATPAGRPDQPPALVLLPFGTRRDGQPLLRYAYRMRLDVTWQGRPVRVLLWADAASGKLLALEPMLKAAGAAGRTFVRDAGSGGTQVVPFEVDPPGADGTFVLSRANVSVRLNYRGGVYDAAEEVAIGGGAFADFDRSPIHDLVDPDDVRCAYPALGRAVNPAFQQVHVMATLWRHRETVLGGGTFEPYPATPWAPTVEYSAWGCNADMTMQFGQCPGYTDPQCPDAPDLLLNFAHDSTMIAHELGHSATSRLVDGRPFDWCAPGGPPTCPLPRGWGLFHDLADFWGAHLESTSCVGGWVGKNVGGTDARRNCLPSPGNPGHSERDWFPRKLEVRAGQTGGDHFPEHRAAAVGGANEYADGQIAGAALWEVRAGMRSKCRPSGVPQFSVRFQRALVHSGFFASIAPDASDRGVYQRLVELLFKLTEQWATAGLPGGPPAFAHNGPHTTNKVTSGFARAGIFLVPWQCLDADPSNDATLGCPAANPGADAVIDVDDDDEADDDLVNGAVVVDRDFLRAAATPVPKFHVWTGPRYRLDGPAGAHTVPSPAPCNDEFQVEVTTDPAFATITAASGWIRVNRLAGGAAPTCYGVWSPDPAQWTQLRLGTPPARIYYRARTRDAGGGTVRLSTEPGNGLWTVPPPYAVITTDGRSSY
jgi:hypothetical protein